MCLSSTRSTPAQCPTANFSFQSLPRPSLSVFIPVLNYKRSDGTGPPPLLRGTMSSADNPPSLALSDIMHPMSPSPVPTDDEKVSNYAQTARTTHDVLDLHPQESSEPFPTPHITNIQSRLQAMGYLSANEASDVEERTLEYVLPPNTSAREQELVEMVRRPPNQHGIDLRTAIDKTTRPTFLRRHKSTRAASRNDIQSPHAEGHDFG